MATILLNVAAQVAMQAISSAVMGGGQSRHREGARLEELSVQTSTYGDFIPLIYGRARVAGNVIWAQPMKEVATTTTTTQGKGGGGASSSATEYSYFATLAIAICEGEVQSIERVWADAKQLDLSQGTYRFYTGGETQLPDATIESFEGVGSVPAYRGLAYVVIEDFPLGDYGNRIPNFTFEVKRALVSAEVDGQPIESLIKEVVLIPGSGEFVYDTDVQEKIAGEEVDGVFVQAGAREVINQHTAQGKANALVALDQLEDTCPNVEWVAVVVNWFGTSMDLGLCEILPGVEFAADEGTTSPEVWSVGNYSRSSAHSITYVDGTPRYGGTPDDQSVYRLCEELQARGKKVLFLPLFLMDTDDKPWRGRLTGTAAQVPNFFTKFTGYNTYIVHYANLLGSVVDAFAIGSEMVGLTSIHDGAATNRAFAGVAQLTTLAATIKGIVGAGVKVTYAADWSEYHHADGGWYHMDPLWASPNIDVIGIDAYFPLTDAPQNEVGYDPLEIAEGWTSGEGYDWYYSDAARTTKASLQPEYAWKNIAWFWENAHTNPDGNATPWVAESKKVWFTEYGFPSIDGATNQPNVFYDPTSLESFYPYHSKGRIDMRAQRSGVAATLAEWKDSSMIERMFLWTWDARPYPYWPDLLSVWADGSVWISGHWVQGKFGTSSLGAIVADLCARAGLSANAIDVSALGDQVDGFVIKRQDTARALIETLMSSYFFDAAETDGTLKFIPRGNASAQSIAWENLAPESGNGGDALQIDRAQELELPQRVEVSYLNRLNQYQTSTQMAQRQVVDTNDVEALNLPIVMDNQRAKVVADVALYQAWLSRTQFSFDLAMEFAALEPTDVITVSDANNVSHLMRVTSMRLGKPGRVRITAVAEDVSAYDFYAPPASGLEAAEAVSVVPNTQARLLDLPTLPNDSADAANLRVATSGLASGWSGAALYRSDDGGASYGEVARTAQASVMGTATTALGDGPRNRFDEAASVDIVLLGDGTLESVSEQALLNGANVALVGDELIQFQNATLIAPNKYRLSRLLRGRLGTEHLTDSHSAGEGFVLLNTAVQKTPVADGLFGLPRDYKVATFGQTLGSVSAESFTYHAAALKPYAPVHVTGTRDGAGNVSISWVRRTRSGGHWRDGGDVVLSEAAELYEIDVMDGSDVVRSMSVPSAEASYSAAQQTADFGGVQSSITLRIYQISERVGRGEGVEATL